jgi:MarR family transcriptional regulator, organic hydroperoxide resistance regulator
MGRRKTRAEGVPRHHEQLFWSIRGIHSLFEAIHDTWANRFGVTTPQLVMVFALRDFDNHGTGLPVKEVARILSVDPTFVTTQSKILEAKGFLSRNASREDARVVRLSLTDKSLNQLAALSTQQKKINDYIFSEFTEQGMHSLVTKVFALKNRMEKASAIASIGLDN